MYGIRGCSFCGTEDKAELLFRAVDEGETECNECNTISPKRGQVEIGEDYVVLKDEEGCEIIKWIEDEIVDDTSVTFVIANAIKLMYEKGPDYIKEKIGKS